MTLTVTEALIGFNSSAYKTPFALQQLTLEFVLEASGKLMFAKAN